METMKLIEAFKQLQVRVAKDMLLKGKVDGPAVIEFIDRVLDQVQKQAVNR